MLRKLVVVTLVVVASGGCSEDPKDNRNDSAGFVCTEGPRGSKSANIDADITADACLSADTTYTLKPKADGSYVKVKAGVTLTIQPGTTIQGTQGSALIVTRGGKIMAEGTAADPIVFTSSKPEASKRPGDWGGLLILGAAPTNWEGNNQLFEALPQTEEDGRYGGDNVEDDSGVLKYVRIEFAGYEYDVGKEFNSLTLCGVGSGTTIDYLQVHRGSDDGVELFGGTVDLKHVVSTLNEDDGFDTDNGWSGRAQFLVIQALNGQSSDPNGYESDNDKTRWSATPLTAPTIYNATLVGQSDSTKDHYGALIRRGATGEYWNHVIMGFKSAAVEIRDSESAEHVPDDLAFRSSIFFGNAGGDNFSGAQVDYDETAFRGELYLNDEVDPLLTAALNVTAPDFRPQVGSPALTGGATPPADGFFDTSATFVGAFGSEDWTAEWTAFPTGG